MVFTTKAATNGDVQARSLGTNAYDRYGAIAVDANYLYLGQSGNIMLYLKYNPLQPYTTTYRPYTARRFR